MNLDLLLAPRSVAIVGAAENVVGVGGKATRNAVGSPGLAVELVNRRGGTIHGKGVYRSLQDLPYVPDAVLIAVPAEQAVHVVEDAARMKIGAAVVYAAGFAEVGPAGRELETEMVAHARAAGMALLGPNCVGIASAANGVDLTSASEFGGLDLGHEIVSPGGVALISQSGSLGIAAKVAHPRRVRHFVSSGNEAILTAAMLLEYLVDADENLRAVGLILETIRDSQRLATAARRAHERGVHVVALRLASGGRAREMAMLHTGGLGGEALAVEAFCRAHRIGLTYSMRTFRAALQVIDAPGWTHVHTTQRPLNVGIFTTSGGSAVTTADAAEERGLSLPPPLPATASRVATVLGIAADRVTNPLDAGGLHAFEPALFVEALRAFSSDPSFDAILVPLGGAGGENARSRTDAILPVLQSGNVAVLPIWQRRPTGEEALHLLERSGVPVFLSHEDALDGLALLAGARAYDTSARTPQRMLDSAARQRPRATRDDGTSVPRAQFAPLAECFERLARAGVPLARWCRMSLDGADAQVALATVGPPVGIKVSHESVVHKTDNGLLVLNVQDLASARAGVRLLNERAHKQGLNEYELVMQEFLEGDWLNVFGSVMRDPEVGLVAVFGLGGIWTELLGDVVSVAVEADTDSLASALVTQAAELRGAELLTGYRGDPGYDLQAACGVLAAAARYVATHPDILAVELNPIAALRPGKGAVALDAKIVEAC